MILLSLAKKGLDPEGEKMDIIKKTFTALTTTAALALSSAMPVSAAVRDGYRIPVIGDFFG